MGGIRLPLDLRWSALDLRWSASGGAVAVGRLLNHLSIFDCIFHSRFHLHLIAIVLLAWNLKHP